MYHQCQLLIDFTVKLSMFILCCKVSVQLYHGPAKDRMALLKRIRKPQGPHNMFPVVVTSFEIAMIDRKFLQVGPTPLLISCKSCI